MLMGFINYHFKARYEEILDRCDKKLREACLLDTMEAISQQLASFFVINTIKDSEETLYFVLQYRKMLV